MLRKYGWDAEKGLGKNNQGMKTALKPVLKFDTRGVGCNQKDEYSSEFKWWEYSYNRAAKKLSQTLEQSDNEERKEKKRKHKEDNEEEKQSSKKSIYSRFEKSSVLMGNKEESLRIEKEAVVSEINTSSIPTDDELLRICGGRTAHKGARHGIHMNGKLQRLQEQEERIFSSSSENLVEQIIMSLRRVAIFGVVSFNRVAKQIKTALPYALGTATAVTYYYIQSSFNKHHAAMLDILHLTPASLDTDVSENYPDKPSESFMAESITNGDILKKGSNVYRQRMEIFILKLQKQLCHSLEQCEGKTNSEIRFKVDRWTRPEGGGGITCVMQNGEVLESAGVNISVVHGKLPAQAVEQMRARGHQFAARNVPLEFFAAGISSVIHPRNPYVPTLHFNYRYFELVDADGKVHWWYGGGTDMTPYYLNENDCKHFHLTLKKACDKHDHSYYPKFKKWCDDYFNITFRHNERRGIGGIFFDDLNQPNQEECFSFVKDCANTVIPSYIPVVQSNYQRSYTTEERDWQLLRRGRYAEFNLVLDRGTKFGLQTPGSRIESILMSLPPVAKWKYAWDYKADSPEMKLMKVLKEPREWV
ncbi:unnamed protein product [Rotaria sordida]|uniref:coproporphyrinogen oxidase n=2 Tax=Rotaria sordida TaxID=392033 RepID=A0A815KHS7_9BILA|nr:unnamed protein product [Rotaria sordida]CAF3824111.1 unnamed protein product [Rotaria sordida]